MNSLGRGSGVLFGGVAASFLVLSLLAVAAKGEFEFIVSDGRGYYVYLPSLIQDHDLDFRNQIVEHWGVDAPPSLNAPPTPRGLIRNRYPIGLALTLLPSFLVAEGVARVGFRLTGFQSLAPDGYSPPYQIAGLITILGLGLATMLILERWLRAFLGIDPRASRWATLLFWVGSPYAYYYFREPFMIHVASLFWIVATLALLGDPASEDRGWPSRRWRAPMAAFCTSMAIVCRPTDVFLLLLVPAFVRAREAPVRERSVSRLWYAAALVPPLAQMLVWKALYGSWVAQTYRGEGFRWGHPALLQTLFSPRHGLFVWSPLLALACAGLWLGRGRWAGPQRRTVVALLLGFLVLWYLNSCWTTWWFGDSFGARAFLEMAPLFVLGLGLVLERALEKGGRTAWVATSLMGAAVTYSWVLMALYIGHRISRSEPLF